MQLALPNLHYPAQIKVLSKTPTTMTDSPFSSKQIYNIFFKHWVGVRGPMDVQQTGQATPRLSFTSSCNFSQYLHPFTSANLASSVAATHLQEFKAVGLDTVTTSFLEVHIFQLEDCQGSGQRWWQKYIPLRALQLLGSTLCMSDSHSRQTLMGCKPLSHLTSSYGF